MRDPDSPVLLTGATGFLGGHLLSELLRQTTAPVVCLVRAPDVRSAMSRLPVRGDRVRAVCGAVDRPRLGLSDDLWRRLADDLGAIYHGAAAVNVVAGYRELRPTNLGGTAEALRLAGEGRPKTLHYLSTLSVFVATDRNRGALLEADGLGSTGTVYGGYAQSKWAAEWLVRRAEGDRSVYRLGLLTPAPGAAGPSSDFLRLFIRGLARLGAVPEAAADALRMDVTPVDFAARAVVRLSLAGTGAAPRTYHVAGAGTLSLARLVAAMRRAGVRLETIPAAEWGRRAETFRDAEAAAAALALCRALPEPMRFERWRTFDLFQATGVTFDRRAADAALAGFDVTCPKPDDALVDGYVAGALR